MRTWKALSKSALAPGWRFSPQTVTKPAGAKGGIAARGRVENKHERSVKARSSHQT